MKPGYSGNYLEGSSTSQRPRDPLSSAAYAYLQQASRNTLAQRGYPSSAPTAWPVGTPHSARSELEKYIESTGMGGTPPTHLTGGYIPPGTHFIPPGFGESHNFSRRSQQGRYPLPPGAFQRPHHHHGLSPSAYYATFSRSAANAASLFPDSDDESFFPVEPLPHLPARRERFSMEFGGGYAAALPSLDERDERRHEAFGERLASFPELPADAHKRIFQMGNEIMDCFEVRLERFYRGSLLDSAENCIAVFTKKERTGQRWLMVFKEDTSRSIIKFNRLLTHSLIVSVTSPTAIEIEAAKCVYGPPSEMCVLNFRNVEEADRFYETLHESQTTAWNHREVSQEQKMKTLISKINVAVALSQSEMLMSGGSVHARPTTPPSRSPFTLSSLRDSCGFLSAAMSATTTAAPRPADSNASSPAPTRSDMIADLDQDWRSRRFNSGSGATERPYVTSSVTSKKSRSALIPSKVSQGQGSNYIYDSMTYANALKKMDGSGDGVGEKEDIISNEEIAFELDDVTLYIKNDLENYEELNKGTLQLVDHGKCSIDELKLVGKSNEEVYQQYIFKWNSITKKWSRSSGGEEGKGQLSIFWDGAATLIHSPNDVPQVRKFKIKVEDDATAEAFIQAFEQSVEKSMDEKARRHHIQWFMKNKGQSLFSSQQKDFK